MHAHVRTHTAGVGGLVTFQPPDKKLRSEEQRAFKNRGGLPPPPVWPEKRLQRKEARLQSAPPPTPTLLGNCNEGGFRLEEELNPTV